jgi:hypothetical protein
MARIKQGVFSWEDVLVQRYQSESKHLVQKFNPKLTRQATNLLPSHAPAAVPYQYGNHNPNAIYYPVYHPSSGS